MSIPAERCLGDGLSVTPPPGPELPLARLYAETASEIRKELDRGGSHLNRGIWRGWRTRYRPAIATFLGNRIFINFAPYTLRHAFLRKFCGIQIGRDSTVAAGCFLTGNRISIGNNTVINRYTYLDGRGPLYIGNNVNVSHYCLIHTLTHSVQSPDFVCEEKPVAIYDYAWIGARSIILPGVTIGEGSVVGAGAVVTRDVAPYAIVVGNPARRIATRPRGLRYTTRYFPLLDTDIQ